MTNSLYQQKVLPANYSGVTINITNPMVNAGVNPCNCPQEPATVQYTEQNYDKIYGLNQPNSPYYYNPSDSLRADIFYNAANVQNTNPQISSNQPYQTSQIPQIQQNTQPAQYYLNNYNYTNTGTSPDALSKLNNSNANGQVFSQDGMSASKEIINNLQEREAKQKELESSSEKKKIVALTNEYIMSLENYLNNPNTDIRLMAAKEILTRFDEDKNRCDDAALNALLNKMLQDPEKIIRIAALSALSSGLATGNDYTIQLLNNIQNNPNADKEDALEVSQILLKMSETSEERYVPVKTNKKEIMPENA